MPPQGKPQLTDEETEILTQWIRKGASFDLRVAELEPLSPEIRLKAGEEYRFPEKWTLVDLGQEVTSFEQARAVVKQIGKSPFK